MGPVWSVVRVAVISGSRFRPTRAVLVGVYKLTLRLFLLLLPGKDATLAVYSKVAWSDCWPGDSDLDLRIVLSHGGDFRTTYHAFSRGISFVRSFRRLFPMLRHVYVVTEPFATRLVSRRGTAVFGDRVPVWHRVWGDPAPDCETISTQPGDVRALRDAFNQYSRELLPFAYRMPCATPVFVRRLYTSIIKVLRHCLYFRGEIGSTTGSFATSLAEIHRKAAQLGYPELARLLERLGSAAEHGFRASFARGELERGLVELIAYLDGVSQTAGARLRCDDFTLSSLHAENGFDSNDRPGARLVERYDAAFSAWLRAPGGILPGHDTLLLSRGPRDVVDAQTLVRMREDPEVHDACPIILSEAMLRIYLALKPHTYFELAKYPQGSRRVAAGDFGTSREILLPVLLNDMNLLSTAFRDRDAVQLLHLFVGVLPMTYLLFERDIVCTRLAECAREYADAGFAFHRRVTDAYATYRASNGGPFGLDETERILAAFGPPAMELAERALAFF